MSSVIRTYTGRLVDLAKPETADIILEDIAHALSQINRFTGHTRVPYSVAEHCLHGSYQVQPKYALEWMLHDATEAYLGDVSSPLKTIIGPEYANLEERWAQEIAFRYGLASANKECHAEIKRVDLLMLRCEMVALLGEAWPVREKYDPVADRVELDIAEKVKLGSREAAEVLFLMRVRELVTERYLEANHG